MRLKYYLRGAGIGIIFATMVMTVSALVHKYNITDEYIIREARKLGMVMKDEIKDSNNNYWGSEGITDNTETEESKNTEESENTEVSKSTEETQETEDTQVVSSETEPSESESESQEPEPPAQPVQYVTIVISSGDYARQVAEKVKAAGLVQNAEDFRKYIGNRGYGRSMFPGTYQVPVGSSYEEICLILIKRPGR